MIKDEQWPVARLIPISSASGVEAQERRAASALLAVLSVVEEFGRALLKPFGAPSGKIETFIEVPFRVNDRAIRPDGIIVVARGARTWGAIVEVKTASNALEADQLDIYLDLARELDFNAVLTVSNQYVTSPNYYPVAVDRRKLKRVSLFHWSWVQVLTEAVVQKEHRGVRDPDQAYILNELIRYLSDPRSGAVSFDDMGPSWTTVRDGARDRTLRKSDPSAEAVVYRWEELIRYLCLDLTKDLGKDVKVVSGRNDQSSPLRQQDLTDSLVNAGRLDAELNVPGAAAPLHVVADLRSRRVICSTRLEAPREGRSKGRVSWLLRQLSKAPPQLTIEARVTRSTASPVVPLTIAQENPSLLYPESGKEIRHFVLSLTRDMGLRRDASRASFIRSVLGTTKDFYANVLQNLRPWKARPPKLRPAPEEIEAREIAVELAPRLRDAIEEASEEMHEVASSVQPVAEEESPLHSANAESSD